MQVLVNSDAEGPAYQMCLCWVSDVVVILVVGLVILIVIILVVFLLKVGPQIRGACGTCEETSRLVLASGHLICFVALADCL